MDAREYFTEQIRAHEKSMYAAAYSVLKNDSDIADAVQDAILKAYTHLDSLRDKNKFRPWIMQIVHNTAVEYIRRRHDEIDINTQTEILPDTADPVDTETKITVQQAVNRLRQPFRETIVLFYYENCSVKEISKITSQPENTVRVQLLRGRKMLAQYLNQEDFIR